MDGALVPLKPQARVILLHTLVAGEVRRGEFAALTGCSERSTRTALSQLLKAPCETASHPTASPIASPIWCPHRLNPEHSEKNPIPESVVQTL